MQHSNASTSGDARAASACGLKDFEVLLIEAELEVPTRFLAQAEDIHHALEQAENAYPGAVLVSATLKPHRGVETIAFPAIVEMAADEVHSFDGIVNCAQAHLITPFPGVAPLSLAAGVHCTGLGDFVRKVPGDEILALDLPIGPWDGESEGTPYRLQVSAQRSGVSFRIWSESEEPDGAAGLEGYLEINNGVPALHLSPRLTTENVAHIHAFDGNLELVGDCRMETRSRFYEGASAHVYSIA